MHSGNFAIWHRAVENEYTRDSAILYSGIRLPVSRTNFECNVRTCGPAQSVSQRQGGAQVLRQVVTRVDTPGDTLPPPPMVARGILGYPR